MRDFNALEILILFLINKHSGLKDIYSLTRFFAKTSVLPNELYKTLDYLVDSGELLINNPEDQIKRYRITPLGLSFLNAINSFEFVEEFALKIDETGFIAEIIYFGK